MLCRIQIVEFLLLTDKMEDHCVAKAKMEAYYVTLMGHEVTIFEQRKKLGGMLRYGIPNYRLLRETLDRKIIMYGKFLEKDRAHLKRSGV